MTKRYRSIAIVAHWVYALRDSRSPRSSSRNGTQCQVCDGTAQRVGPVGKRWEKSGLMQEVKEDLKGEEAVRTRRVEEMPSLPGTWGPSAAKDFLQHLSRPVSVHSHISLSGGDIKPICLLSGDI